MTQLYHITHMQNLQSILVQDGLWCDNARQELSLDPIGIAHDHIKQRRARKRVPLGAQGTLADYVPFYFAPRSPMLYAIHTGAVSGYNGGQGSVVHLVFEVEHILQHGLSYLFTDGHAEMMISRFFSDPAHFDQIDWQIMQERYWNDTMMDGDRKRRRQAEFLVHRFVPWVLCREIGVINTHIAEEVNAVLQAATHRPHVHVQRPWYY